MNRSFYYWYAVIPKDSLNPEQFARSCQARSITPEIWTFRKLSAVVTRTKISRVVLNPETAWQHERIIEMISDITHYQTLPFRFGSVHPAEQLMNILTERHDEWLDALDAIKGRVEMSLKVLSSRSSDAALGIRIPSSSYLDRLMRERLQQKARLKEAQSIALVIDKHLKSWYVRKFEDAEALPGILINQTYLVEKDQVPMFQDSVRTLIQEFGTRKWLCTGPWPPYHFVTDRPNQEKTDGKKEEPNELEKRPPGHFE